MNKNISSINSLAKHLSRSEKVNSFDDENGQECGRIAHSLSDIEGSMVEIFEKLAPKLENENITPDEIDDVLFDIAGELRHIAYHINEPRYWKHIVSDS